MLSYKLVVILVVALACPGTLFAQDAQRPSLKLPTVMFAAAASADWATTYHGLKHYRLRESNPLLRPFERTPAKMVLLGGAIDIGGVALWNTLFPYTTLFRSESEERRVGKECKIGRAHV